MLKRPALRARTQFDRSGCGNRVEATQDACSFTRNVQRLHPSNLLLPNTRPLDDSLPNTELIPSLSLCEISTRAAEHSWPEKVKLIGNEATPQDVINADAFVPARRI